MLTPGSALRVGASAIFPFSANLDLQFGAAYAAKGATEQELGVDLVLSSTTSRYHCF